MNLLLATDDDSLIGSCNCLTKTPEVKYHKKGCKYRLIVERNEARAERDELRKELNMSNSDAQSLCDRYKETREKLKIHEMTETCSQCGGKYNPSWVESGWCINCIFEEVKEERDRLKEKYER